MNPHHNFQTAIIAICAASALLCASCATGATEQTEAPNPKKRSRLLAEMGTQAMMRGDLPQAIEDLRKAVVADDENAGAHNNLGLSYWQMGRKELAKNALRRALEIDPKNADANINLGTVASEENDLKTARKYYKAAIDNLEYRSRHRALTNLAQLALRENNTDEARELLYQSLQANPAYCKSHFLLGTIFLNEGNMRPAADELKKSVASTCVGNVEAHYKLGTAYMKLKQYDKARSEFVLLIDQFPQTLQAQRAGDQLKNLP